MPTTTRPPLPARLPDGLVTPVRSPAEADVLRIAGRCYHQPFPEADWNLMTPDGIGWVRPSLGWGNGNSYGEAAAEALLPPLGVPVSTLEADAEMLNMVIPAVADYLWTQGRLYFRSREGFNWNHMDDTWGRPSENWGICSYATPSPPSPSPSPSDDVWADVWAPPAGVLGPTPGENIPDGHARVMASRPPTDEALRTRRSAPRAGVLYWHRPVPVQPVAARPGDVVVVPEGGVGEVVGVMETAQGVAYVWVHISPRTPEVAPRTFRRDRVSIESRGGMGWECVGSEDRCGPENPWHDSPCGFPPPF